MLGDFHLHTYYSDGIFSPLEVVSRACSRGVSVLAITDHDTVAGWEETLKAGEETLVHVVSGIEITSRTGALDAHILGYGVDTGHPALRKARERFRSERIARIERIMAKLEAMGMAIRRDRVMSGAERGTIGRPHVARELVAAGHASSQQQAFSKFLNYGLPAYEPPFQLPSEETIKLTHEAGGIAVLAHPAGYFSRTVLGTLRDEGLDGVEVYHPSHDKETVKHYAKLAAELGLLVTGGSDFHGARRSDERALGTFGIRDGELEIFLERVGAPFEISIQNLKSKI